MIDGTAQLAEGNRCCLRGLPGPPAQQMGLQRIGKAIEGEAHETQHENADHDERHVEPLAAGNDETADARADRQEIFCLLIVEEQQQRRPRIGVCGGIDDEIGITLQPLDNGIGLSSNSCWN